MNDSFEITNICGFRNSRRACSNDQFGVAVRPEPTRKCPICANLQCCGRIPELARSLPTMCRSGALHNDARYLARREALAALLRPVSVLIINLLTEGYACAVARAQALLSTLPTLLTERLLL
jgi:hypothetical protein